MYDPGRAIRVQCFVSLIFNVILYIWPEYLLSFIIRVETDGVHWHMARCPASVLIALSLLCSYWSKSTDACANTATIHTSILTAAFGLAATWYAKVYGIDYFYPKTLTLIMCFFAVVIIFNIYLLLRSGWPIGLIQFEPDRQSIINRLLICDSYAAFIFGCLWVAYPDLILRRQVRFPLTQHHAYVCRIFGGALASTSACSSAAVYFRNASDRMSGLCCRLLITVLVLASQLHSQYAYEQWWTHAHWVGMSLWTVWLALVVMCGVNALRGKWR